MNLIKTKTQKTYMSKTKATNDAAVIAEPAQERKIANARVRPMSLIINKNTINLHVA